MLKTEIEHMLKMKQIPPPVAAPLIKRPRLDNLLTTCARQKLTMLVAPAGYGKTTALVEWVLYRERYGWPTAWLQLDQDDDDPKQFWTQFIYCLQANDILQASAPTSSSQNGFTELLQSGQAHQALASLINDIGELDKHFIVVIDRFELIQAGDLHGQISYFIAHMHPSLHIVIASREQPLFKLSELRASNQLKEISWKDLSFTLGETQELLEDVIDLRLELDEIAKLLRLTEGWITGLKFFGQSLQASKDRRRLLKSLSGNQRHVKEFLTETVLANQDQTSLDFLYRSSIFDRLTASTCDFVLGTEGSWDLLQKFEDGGIFIFPIDRERRVYRYHPVFRDVLQEELLHKYHKEIPDLNHRAGVWLCMNNAQAEAIPYLLAGNDYDLAASTIEVCGASVLREGHAVELFEWLAQIPEPIFEQNFGLRLISAETSLSVGRLDLFEQEMLLLERIKAPESLNRIQDGQDDGSVPDDSSSNNNNNNNNNNNKSLNTVDQKRLETLELVRHCIHGNIESWLESHSLSLLAQDSADGSAILGAAYHYLSLAYYALDKPGQATKTLETTSSYVLMNSLSYLYMSTQWLRILFFRYQGYLEEAKRASRELMDYARVCDNARKNDGFLMAAVNLALILWEQDSIEESREYLQQAIKSLAIVEEVSPYQTAAMGAYIGLGQYFLTDGNVHEAVLLNNKNKEDYQYYTRFISGFYPEALDLQVRLWLAEGDIASANRWAQEIEQKLEAKAQIAIVQKLAYCRVLLATNKKSEALTQLAELEEQAQSVGAYEYLLQCLILDALESQSEGNLDRAVAKLAKALALAWPRGYMRIFADHHKPMARLLKKLLHNLESRIDKPNAQGKTKDKTIKFVRDLLVITEQNKNSKVGQSKVKHAVKPKNSKNLGDAGSLVLSERETQILTLLSQDLTTSQIANKLAISENTTKVHIRHIYKKLGVHSRDQAIARTIE